MSFPNLRQSIASTTSSQQPTTYATSTTIIPGSTTESQTKYPTTTVKNEDTTRGSASVKFTSTNEDTSFMTYPSTTTTLKKISGSVTMFIDISTYGTQSTTTTHETSAKDHSLLIITISIIGLLVAVICGLLIVIFWRRRIPKGSDKTDKTKLYETLKSPDTKTSNEGDNVYRLVSFENSRPTVRIKGVLGEYNGEFQSNYKSFSANVDYHDEDEHYVTLP